MIVQNSIVKFHVCFYTPVERRDVLWNGPVRPSVNPSVCQFTIACERDILKTACQIDFTFWYGLNTTKTSDAIDMGHSSKTKMAATAVWRLTLYPIQDIACERDILKIACRIDWPCPSVRQSVRLSVRQFTIACERDILKTACQIDFTFWYNLNTTKTSDAIDLGNFY